MRVTLTFTRMYSKIGNEYEHNWVDKLIVTMLTLAMFTFDQFGEYTYFDYTEEV